MAKQNVVATKTAAKPTKVERTVKPLFTGVRDQAGKLTSYEGFDPKNFAPLKRAEFAEIATYLDFRAAMLEGSIARVTKKITDFREKANRMRQFGSTEASKKVNKFQRLENSAVAILAELKGELTPEQIQDLLKGLETKLREGVAA